jgi:hypothetical protein
VRVDLRERKVPEGEADLPGELLLDALDLPKRLSRIRAFVVAVLEDEASGRRAANMVDPLLERFQCARRISCIAPRLLRTRPTVG